MVSTVLLRPKLSRSGHAALVLSCEVRKDLELKDRGERAEIGLAVEGEEIGASGFLGCRKDHQVRNCDTSLVGETWDQTASNAFELFSSKISKLEACSEVCLQFLPLFGGRLAAQVRENSFGFEKDRTRQKAGNIYPREETLNNLRSPEVLIFEVGRYQPVCIDEWFHRRSRPRVMCIISSTSLLPTLRPCLRSHSKCAFQPTPFTGFSTAAFPLRCFATVCSFVLERGSPRRLSRAWRIRAFRVLRRLRASRSKCSARFLSRRSTNSVVIEIELKGKEQSGKFQFLSHASETKKRIGTT